LEIVKLEEIREGDLIVADRTSIDDARVSRRDEDMAEMMGVLCGDGSYTRDRDFCVAMAADDLAYREHVQDLIGRLWPGVNCPARENKGSKGKCVSIDVTNKPARTELLELGLECVSGKDKKIPEWIFSVNKRSRVRALKGLYDTDGGVTNGTVQFTNISEHLARGFSDLCATVGIPATIKRYKEAFRVHVDSRFAQEFVDLVKPFHPRKGSVKVRGRSPLPSDLIKAVADKIMHSAQWQDRVEERRTVTRKTSNSTWKSREHTYVKHAVFSRGERSHIYRMACGSGSAEGCLSYLGRIEVDDEARNLIDLVQLPWARVRHITPEGVMPTMDIEILSDDHCYVSGGLVMHNSAADLMKVGMRNIYRRLEEEDRLHHTGILLQVHDEVTVECPEEDAPYIADLVRTEMENAFKISLPIVAEGSVAKSWGEAK
jgi:hypothetical protein